MPLRVSSPGGPEWSLSGYLPSQARSTPSVIQKIAQNSDSDVTRRRGMSYHLPHQPFTTHNLASQLLSRTMNIIVTPLPPSALLLSASRTVRSAERRTRRSARQSAGQGARPTPRKGRPTRLSQGVAALNNVVDGAATADPTRAATGNFERTWAPPGGAGD